MTITAHDIDMQWVLDMANREAPERLDANSQKVWLMLSNMVRMGVGTLLAVADIAVRSGDRRTEFQEIGEDILQAMEPLVTHLVHLQMTALIAEKVEELARLN